MNKEIKEILLDGAFIPAHPLVLTGSLELDEARQRRLTRYYLASGVDGLAVGVHTTQFEIRQTMFNLLEPVLQLAMEEVKKAKEKKPVIMVAGVCGPTDQALKEAELAKRLGYHAGLVSLGGLNNYSEDQLIKHIEAVAGIIPVFGFYLQPAVGGQLLSYGFWRRMAEIPNVVAIKAAPFNRFQTMDVVRAVCESSRRDDIALYTGNDDNIVLDLLAQYEFDIRGQRVKKGFSGGLLGHWSVWTHKSVELFRAIKACRANKYQGIEELLIKANAVTDMNAAIFDPQHSFRGSIAGIHEVLRRQGLMAGIWALSPKEKLSPGQSEEIDRVITQYPGLSDDSFIKEFLENDK